MPNPQPGAPDFCIYNPGDRVTQLYPRALGPHFGHILQPVWVTVRLFLFPGCHMGECSYLIIIIIIGSTALPGPWPSSEASASGSIQLLLLQILWQESFPGWGCQPHAQHPAILEGRCFLSGKSPLADLFQKLLVETDICRRTFNNTYIDILSHTFVIKKGKKDINW
jgi:hypothetical protein